MNFGLSFLPDCSYLNKSAHDYYKEIIKLSCLADKAGLEYIKITEHYLHPYGGYCPNPIVFLSAVGVLTKRIRLMTGCILPAFHHPSYIA